MLRDLRQVGVPRYYLEGDQRAEGRKFKAVKPNHRAEEGEGVGPATDHFLHTKAGLARVPSGSLQLK